MTTKTKTGGCQCGRIRFEVSGEPIWIGFCHCARCRRATGAAAVTHVGVNPADLTFTRGRLKIYESSPGVRRGFCADCGTPFTYDGDRFPDYIQLYLGTFDEPDQLHPQAHVHMAEKVDWYEVADELPRYPGSATADGDSWKD